ncbi:ClC family H(+)/Cl(-) exchange transporter [Fusobacterium russii]|uniref:ClC family H(+)/Cl(-) exchange transporter n=1 Tax=Fusobacterium russii TaxID=854 RepID=UPI0003A172DF|nr:ClC family H(+)/Cl(-) exchange transporter [Fusobacterium russii]
MDCSENTEKTLKNLSETKGKLYLLCLFIGIITGFTVSFYRWGLEKISHIREYFFQSSFLESPFLFFKIWLVFMIVGFLLDFLYKKYPKTSGSGIPQVKALILGKMDYKNWFQELLAKFVAGVLGIGAGLSLGREGPSVQLGSYIGYGVSKIFKRSYKDRNYLIISGSSAGLAGAFGAPVAGVMFSIEEIYRYINGKLLTCVFISSIAANFIGRRIFGINTAFNLIISYPLNINHYLQFILYIIFGVVIAFFGKLFTYALIKAQDIFNGTKAPRWIKISTIMSSSFFLCFIFPEVLGGGHHLAESLGYRKETLWFLVLIFIVKLVFTAISYSTGFAGGIFLPMLVLGALVGKIFGETVDLFLATGGEFTIHFVVLGMAAYFVSVVRAPLTGIILILEMTGSFVLLFAIATTAIVSYYITELLKQEPIYEILYERMKKDNMDADGKNKNKTIIKVHVMEGSELDGKTISEAFSPEEMLVISIIKNEIEKIPNGKTMIKAGDVLVLLLPEEKVAEIKEKLIERASVK